MADDKTQHLSDKIDALKDDLKEHFEELHLGKDELLRVHQALDIARSAVLSTVLHQHHDLNDELAESPEDHPREQGQGERPPISTDEDVNQAAVDGNVQPVVSGAPVDAEPVEDSQSDTPDDAERRVGSDDEPHAPLAG